MLELRYGRRWQIAGGTLMVLTLAAAILPQLPFWRSVPGTGFEHADKIMHFLTFFILTVYFCGQYPRSAYWRIALGLLAFGALIEILQSFVGYRLAEGADLLADAVGVAAGLAAAVAGIGGWSLHAERWLAAR